MADLEKVKGWKVGDQVFDDRASAARRVAELKVEEWIANRTGIEGDNADLVGRAMFEDAAWLIEALKGLLPPKVRAPKDPNAPKTTRRKKGGEDAAKA